MLAGSLSGACGGEYLGFPVSPEGQRSLPPDVEIIALDATNIDSFSRPARGYHVTSLPSGRQWNYLVGVGDILSVIVFDHPELTLPEGAQRSAAEGGFRVQSDGTINYPFVGAIRAQGRPPEQIRDELTARLAGFIPNPQVEVQGFLRAGITQNNPVLRNGDVVDVPRRRAEEAYLLGEVSQRDAIDLSQETVTLTQAITRQGGLQTPRADMRGVFVFRLAGAITRVFQIDTSTPTGLLLGTRFVLEPGDVVYVVRSPLQRWNGTISRLLPSVQALTVAEGIVN